jgi:uncharacterized metal-binding protein YceD (DUF177 family)
MNVDTVTLCEWRFYHTHFTGQFVAECSRCGTVSVYWEDPEELQQVCEASDAE